MENIKSTWTLEKFFEEVRASQKHPDGSVCLTKDTQEHLVKLVEKFAGFRIDPEVKEQFLVLHGTMGPYVLKINQRPYLIDSKSVRYVKSFTDREFARNFIANNYCKTTKKFKHEQ